MNSVNKNFLFSSVGNNTNFDSLWINEDMNYDIYIMVMMILFIISINRK